MTSPPLDPRTLELINQELMARLERLSQTTSQVESKAIFVAGFVAAAAQFLATQPTHRAWATAAFSAYALAFLFALLTVSLSRYRDIEPRALLDQYGPVTAERALATLAAVRVVAFEKNQKRNARKVIRWWISVAALAVGLILSVAAMVRSNEHGNPAGAFATTPAAAVSAFAAAARR